MGETIRIVNPIDDPDWDELILAQRGYSFFHSSAWARTLAEAYGYDPCYIVLTDHALLPMMSVCSRLTGRRGISLPFTDVCPILHTSHEQAWRLLEEAIRHGRQVHWRYIELRTREPIRHADLCSDYAEHHVGLTSGSETIFSTFKSSVRRAIRKAEKAGLTITVSQSHDALRTFYRLNCRTRKEHGLPPQPFSFFRALHRNALAASKGIIVLARQGGRAIAGALFLHMGQHAVYKYGASDRRHLGLRANNAVMWAAIRWYAAHGFETLSLGKTRLTNAGLLQFKRGWCTEEDKIHYYHYDLSEQGFTQVNDHVAGVHNVLFRHMPIFAARMAGHLLYRHVA